jgi:hypothetical protein
MAAAISNGGTMTKLFIGTSLALPQARHERSPGEPLPKR